jgi:hypothetical protein
VCDDDEAEDEVEGDSGEEAEAPLTMPASAARVVAPPAAQPKGILKKESKAVPTLKRARTNALQKPEAVSIAAGPAASFVLATHDGDCGLGMKQEVAVEAALFKTFLPGGWAYDADTDRIVPASRRQSVLHTVLLKASCVCVCVCVSVRAPAPF